jgi:glycolate oxidase iron-sulfur subunit
LISFTVEEARTATIDGVPLPSDDLLRQCIHCGLCLPVCPTYALTLRERSSPRGRLRLIKSVVEEQLDWQSTVFAEEMFFCLDCRACETACPAGVNYGELVEAARGQLQALAEDSGQTSRLRRLILREVFARPSRIKQLARLLRWTKRLGLQELALRTGLLKIVSSKLHQLAPMAPDVAAIFSDEAMPELLPARGERRYRVGLITGCVQNVVYPQVNIDTAEVLARNGCEVHVPKSQACCGSLHGHTGDQSTARDLAKRMVGVFEPLDLDAIIINAAGCGSFMKHYGHLLADDPEWAGRAAAFAAKVKDVHEFLVEAGFEPPTRPLNKRVTYHEACHLVHGQKVSDQPRQILRALPGVELVELPEATWCCGSAGIYNITHTETALALLDRKLDHLEETGADVVATANPGCQIQLEYGIRRRGLKVEVVHPVTLLRRGYG